MAALTYITTCKGRLAHLKQSLPRVAGQPDVACIVVDYSCPDGTASWVKANHPQVQVVEVRNESGFNLARARNLGARVAQTPWLGFFDADMLLDRSFGAAVAPTLAPGYFYRAQPATRQSWGSIVVAAEDFAAVGGYDEVYAGWGAEDDDFTAGLAVLGRRAASFPAALLDEVPHTDEMRTRFYEIQDMFVTHSINQYYKQIKFDAMRMIGQPLTAENRRSIYDQIKRKVLAAREGGDGTPAKMDIHIPPQLIFPPATDAPRARPEAAQLKRTITYTLTFGPPPALPGR